MAALGGVLLVLQSASHAQGGSNALEFFKNYFVTGDYAVGGVGLRGRGVNGMATGSIAMSGVPANADIVGAFLYWQEVSKQSLGPASGTTGATFNGAQLTVANGAFPKVLNPSGTAPCWSSGGATGSSGGQHRTYTYRSDVLRLLPIDPSGRALVNGAHQVRLPDAGSKGNGVPIALGASLLVVYRDPTMPLRGIVIDDGGYTMDQSTQSMTQRIEGFYQSAPGSAKLTHIVGSAQANKSERLLLPGRAPIFNPFTGAMGASWDNPTFAVSVPAGSDSTVTSVDHLGFSSFDCLTWGAVVFSTPVQDTDGDGLLDVWETAAHLTDPNGQALPNLSAMGANPNHKDVFAEIGYMHAPDGTTYGGVAKPAHDHLPAPAALRMAGDAFRNAPVANPDGTTGINVHFDVGGHYQPGQADQQGEGSALDPYIIPASLARGGEAIAEAACVPDTQSPPRWMCQFAGYPGTVHWKVEYQLYRDAPVADDGEPISPAELAACRAAGDCRRRFDRVRKDMFRYVLGAHFVALPKAACLNADGSANLVCEQTNPDYHVPRTTSGIADFPGGDVMLTLGGFADAAGRPVGTPFMQAATLMHELGHTFELTHAGVPQTPPEPNCKPNYLSTMNYLFQLRGLFNDVEPGVPHLDFSNAALGGLDEPFLSDGPLAGAPSYRTGWYAPQGPNTIGSAAKRFCNGSAFPNPLPAGWVPMVRVDATSVGGPIDWNKNGDPFNTAFAQDINFNGQVAALNAGSNDWATLLLNQLGSRRAAGRLSHGDDGYWDLGDDEGYWDLGEDGYWDLGDGDGYWDLGDDEGYWDLGAADEVDEEIAAAAGNTPPTELKACVIGVGACVGLPAEFHRIRLDWKIPNVGSVVKYFAYRRIASDPPATNTLLGSVTAQVGTLAYTFVDADELKDGESYVYFVTAEFVDDDGNALTPPPTSGPSNEVTIAAVNDAPVAGNQSVTLGGASVAITLTASDVDSASLAFTIVTPPSHGTLTGTLPNVTYVRKPDYLGPDSFTFKANDTKLPWNDPGRDSNMATVSITVTR